MGRKYDFELLIVRHGQAQEAHPEGDAQRALTPEGRAAIERCSPAWVRLGWHWSRAVHSPLVRARQTAQLLWQQLGPGLLETERTELLEPETFELLRPQADPRHTARALIEAGNRLADPRPRLAVFGHAPNLTRLASLLVTGEDRPAFSLGCGDVLHLFVPAPSPFDLILDPVEQEPLPQAVVLGAYSRQVLELAGQGAQ